MGRNNFPGMKKKIPWEQIKSSIITKDHGHCEQQSNCLEIIWATVPVPLPTLTSEEVAYLSTRETRRNSSAC